MKVAMKLNEILSNEELTEISIKHAVAVGAAALSLVGSNVINKKPSAPPFTGQSIHKQVNTDEIHKLTKAVLNNYVIDKVHAAKIVALAKKHEKPIFPKAKDILAVIGIESRFNPQAVSKLKHDPAIGLMQVRPKAWGLEKTNLHDDNSQIAAGVDVLEKYYKRLKNPEDTIHAYNIGMKNFLTGKHNIRYVAKYNDELLKYN